MVKLFKSSLLVATIASLATVSFAAKDLSLVPLNKNIYFANTLNFKYYELINTSSQKIKFRSSLSNNNLRIIPKLSTCRNSIAAHGSCKLALQVNVEPSVKAFNSKLTIRSTQQTINTPIKFKEIVPQKNKLTTANDWQQLAQDFGTQTIVTVDTDPFNNNILIVSTTDSSKNLSNYRSDDAGKTWQKISNPDAQFSPNGFVFTRTAIYTYSQYKQAMAPYFGIYKSTDGGKTWQGLDNGLGNYGSNQPSDLTYNANTNTLYLTYEGLGLYSLKDGDTTWISLTAAFSKATSTSSAEAVCSVGNTLYVGADQHGLFKSTDNGASWSQVPGLPTDQSPSIMTASSNGTLYVYMISSDFSSKTLYRSKDGGATWQSIKSDFIMNLAAFGDQIMYASNGQVNISNDDGSNWSTFNTGLFTDEINVDKNGDLYAAAAGGFFISKKGTNKWLPSETGFAGPTVTSVLKLSDGTLLAGTNSNTVYYSSDNGQTWTQSSGIAITDSRQINNLQQAPDGNVFLSTMHNYYISKDSGKTWTALNVKGSDPYFPDGLLATTDADGKSTLYASFDHVDDPEFMTSYSKDDGATWTQVGVLDGDEYQKIQLALYNDKTAPKLFGINDSGDSSTQQLYRADALKPVGEWQQVSPDNTGHVNSITDIHKNVTTPETIFAACDTGLFYSTNGNADTMTWSQVTGLPSGNISSIMQSSTAQGTKLIADADANGFYQSLDNGKTWSKLTSQASIDKKTESTSNGDLLVGGSQGVAELGL